MTKLKGLKGVANNLAESFVSATNARFLRLIKERFHERANIEIDLLKGKVRNIDPKWERAKETIERYKNWLSEEIEKLGITNEVEEAKISLTYEP